MDHRTIMYTVENDLCCGCGVCKGICPKNCISWHNEHGLYLPSIDETRCVNCGLCASLCPGLGHIYEPRGDALSTVTGNVLASFNAWSREPYLRHISASGGVVTTMVEALLSQGRYDSAFCLDTYDYRQQLRSRRHTCETFLLNRENTATPKSRYLPVSHEEAVCYMMENRHERIILVATSCALRGICAAIEKLALSRENYLLVGLFCDKVFNYNVLSYFQNRFCGGKALAALHFKNKESGGWPGNMKVYPASGEPFYQPKTERERAKAYFMPERCLYCVDKLNVQADISLGDNYTGIHSSELGSNSVILRTPRGREAWNAVRERMEAVPVDIDVIQKAQYLEGRLNNLYYGELKASRLGKRLDLNPGVPREQDFAAFRWAWKSHMRRLSAGLNYDTNPQKLEKQMRRDSQKPNSVVAFCRRSMAWLYRHVEVFKHV